MSTPNPLPIIPPTTPVKFAPLAPAITAAGLATHASSELLRYAADGFAMPHHPFGTSDPTVELAKALVMTATIEHDSLATLADGFDRSEETGLLAQLIAAGKKFLFDYAGEEL